MNDYQTFFVQMFKRNWILRNVLVNHEVFWTKSSLDFEEKTHELRNYLAIHSAGGNLEKFKEREAEYVALGIFSPVPSEDAGLLDPGNLALIRQQINDTYFDYKLPGGLRVVDFLWDVYHEKKRKIGSKEMGDTIKNCFDSALGPICEFEYLPSKTSASSTRYLKLNWKKGSITYALLMAFETGHFTRQMGELAASKPYRLINETSVSSARQTFTVLCALDFGEALKFHAKQTGLILVQALSLVKLFSELERLKPIHHQDLILENLHAIFDENKNPISVDEGLAKLQKNLSRSKPE